MNTARIIPCILAVAAAALLAGCTRTVDRIERAEPLATPNIVEDHRVLTATGLHHYVRVVQLRETVVSGDLLKIEVEVENLRRSPERFNYAFEWYDREGMRIREPQWRSQVVQGHQRASFSAVANTADAVDFRLHLQRGAR